MEGEKPRFLIVNLMVGDTLYKDHVMSFKFKSVSNMLNEYQYSYNIQQSTVTIEASQGIFLMTSFIDVIDDFLLTFNKDKPITIKDHMFSEDVSCFPKKYADKRKPYSYFNLLEGNNLDTFFNCMDENGISLNVICESSISGDVKKYLDSLNKSYKDYLDFVKLFPQKPIQAMVNFFGTKRERKKSMFTPFRLQDNWYFDGAYFNREKTQVDTMRYQLFKVINDERTSPVYCAIVGAPGTGKSLALSKLSTYFSGLGFIPLVITFNSNMNATLLLHGRGVVEFSTAVRLIISYLYDSFSGYEHLLSFLCKTFKDKPLSIEKALTCIVDDAKSSSSDAFRDGIPSTEEKPFIPKLCICIDEILNVSFLDNCAAVPLPHVKFYKLKGEIKVYTNEYFKEGNKIVIPKGYGIEVEPYGYNKHTGNPFNPEMDKSFKDTINDPVKFISKVDHSIRYDCPVMSDIQNYDIEINYHYISKKTFEFTTEDDPDSTVISPCYYVTDDRHKYAFDPSQTKTSLDILSKFSSYVARVPNYLLFVTSLDPIFVYEGISASTRPINCASLPCAEPNDTIELAHIGICNGLNMLVDGLKSNLERLIEVKKENYNKENTFAVQTHNTRLANLTTEATKSVSSLKRFIGVSSTTSFSYLVRDCGGHFRTLQRLFTDLYINAQLFPKESDVIPETVKCIVSNLFNTSKLYVPSYFFKPIVLALKNKTVQIDTVIARYIKEGFLFNQ